MAELNKVLLIGRLTKDPDLRYTPGGLAVAEFRLAVNHTYRTKEEKREETCFVDVSVFGRSGEVVKQYLQKGREVFVEGRLQFDAWEGPNGEKRSKHRVIADRFQFLGSGSGAGGSKQDSGSSFDSQGSDDYPPREQAREAAAGDDDLPF